MKIQPENHKLPAAKEEKPVVRVSKRGKKVEIIEPQLSVGQYINKIFRESSLDEYQRQYEGGGILKQLLAIEKSLKDYIDFKKMNEAARKDWDFKTPNPRPDISEARRRKEEQLKKLELQRQALSQELNQDYERKARGRAPNSKTFIPKKEAPPKVDLKDKERERYNKYFKDATS